MLLAILLRGVQGLRSSHENEHKIRAILYSLGFFLMLFNPDVGVSSAIYSNYQPLYGTLILAVVFASTLYLAHRFEQSMHDRGLRRGPEKQEEDSPRGGNAAVQENMRQIVACLQERGRYQHRSAEKQIHEILARSDKAMMNELLERMAQSGDCSLERVLGHFRDTAERASRCELIELLCMHRQDVLSVRAKSALLHTLMVMKMSSCSSAEMAVESLLLSAEGDELSELKSTLDGNGDIYSMHKLVFEDVTDPDIKDRVLSHFLREGTAQVAHRALMASGHFRELLCLGRRHGCMPQHLSFFRDSERDPSPGGSRVGPSYDGRCGHSWLKIITDMDDTLQCSGGRWPAGIDARYPRHTPYPGVTAFYRELQGGGELGQLVALSARPHLVSDIVERGIFERFAKLQEENGLHTMPALLTGALDSGIKFASSGGGDEGMRALALKKFEKFEEYIALYPEFRVVFIGDNGQADYAVGQMMCRQYPHNIEQVWIHKVQPESKTWGYEPNSVAPVAFFEDYVASAVSAATRPSPLIGADALHRIVRAAIEDFKKISNWPTPAHREAALSDLNASVVRGCTALRALGRNADDIELIDADKVLTAAPDAQPAVASATPGIIEDASGKSLFGRALSYAKGARASAAQVPEGDAASAIALPAAAREGFAEVSIQTDDLQRHLDAAPASLGDAAAVRTPGTGETPTTVLPVEGERRSSVSLIGRALGNFVGGASHASAAATPHGGSPIAHSKKPDEVAPQDMPPPAPDLPQLDDRGSAAVSGSELAMPQPTIATHAAFALVPVAAAPADVIRPEGGSSGGLSIFGIARGLLPSASPKPVSCNSNSSEASQAVTPSLAPHLAEPPPAASDAAAPAGASSAAAAPTPPASAVPAPPAPPPMPELSGEGGDNSVALQPTPSGPVAVQGGAVDLAAAAPSQFSSLLARALGGIRTAPPADAASEEASTPAHARTGEASTHAAKAKAETAGEEPPSPIPGVAPAEPSTPTDAKVWSFQQCDASSASVPAEGSTEVTTSANPEPAAPGAKAVEPHQQPQPTQHAQLHQEQLQQQEALQHDAHQKEDVKEPKTGSKPMLKPTSPPKAQSTSPKGQQTKLPHHPPSLPPPPATQQRSFFELARAGLKRRTRSTSPTEVEPRPAVSGAFLLPAVAEGTTQADAKAAWAETAAAGALSEPGPANAGAEFAPEGAADIAGEQAAAGAAKAAAVTAAAAALVAAALAAAASEGATKEASTQQEGAATAAPAESSTEKPPRRSLFGLSRGGKVSVAGDKQERLSSVAEAVAKQGESSAERLAAPPTPLPASASEVDQTEPLPTPAPTLAPAASPGSSADGGGEQEARAEGPGTASELTRLSPSDSFVSVAGLAQDSLSRDSSSPEMLQLSGAGPSGGAGGAKH
mmetsp:Transcript_101208/g.325151  ORF Transcript_101208/g.325151 Transcript_101208/m.325151 type:complete len:1400 (-) Transcript_101208:161-4360(-)